MQWKARGWSSRQSCHLRKVYLLAATSTPSYSRTSPPYRICLPLPSRKCGRGLNIVQSSLTQAERTTNQLLVEHQCFTWHSLGTTLPQASRPQLSYRFGRRQHLDSMNMNPSPQQLQQWFQAVDTDRSGHIDVKELQKALSLSKMNFSLAVCRQIIRLYDKTNSGSITLQDFGELHKFLDKMQTQYNQHNVSRSGLGPQEVWNAIQSEGYTLDGPAYQAALAAYDPDRNGRLELTEFIAFSLFLRCAADSFKAFDFQRSGTVSLSLNQFIYAAANCR